VVTETVYFGTDTHYHLQLDNGATLVSRQQNARDQESAFTVGTRVGIHWDKNAAQILTD
jgi:spermidine/putrescine transport system ATP-binding protein